MATTSEARATGPSLAADALKLAREGLEVFPCGPDKSPRTPRGFHDATSNEEVVAGWEWDGLIAARVPAGQLVLDVDPRNGGDETIEALKAAGHTLPKTRVVSTGGGGRHYYYRVPEDLELRSKLGKGVDVKRRASGYVIVPPSPGYRYSKGRLPVAEAPEWLLDALRVQRGESQVCEAGPPRFFVWETGTSYGLKALEDVLEELSQAGPGERNNALNRAAFRLAQLTAGGELEEEATLKALDETAQELGLSTFEIRRTIESGWRAGSADPRQAPPLAEGATQVSVPVAVTMPVDTSRFWLDWQVDEGEPPFMYPPLLPENAYVLVYGATEASKSMVWNAIAAEGSRQGVRSTVYSLENPPHIDRDRLRRLGPDPDNFRITNEPLDLNDRAQFEAMIEREVDWGTRLILIDTYSHAFASRSEDGNARAIEFARRIRFLMHETGASVVLIDHTGYMQEDEPRDASAKRQQVDVAILMKKDGEWAPGAPAKFFMENKKAARFGNPFSITGQIKDVAREDNERGLELQWLAGVKPTWTV